MPLPDEAVILLRHGGRQGRGDDVRQVAGDRQRPIVLLRRHANDHRAQRLPKLLKRSKSSARVLRVGVMTATRPSNSSASADVAPVFSLPAMGWLPRKRQPRGSPSSRAAARSPLRAAGVGDERSLRAMPGRLADEIGDVGHGRADDDQVGLGDPFGDVDGGLRDGPHPPGDPQADLAAADADDRVGQLSLAQGQADRSSDQADAHDRHVSQMFHNGVRPARCWGWSAIVAEARGEEAGGPAWACRFAMGTAQKTRARRQQWRPAIHRSPP